jgi:outer membrane lipopolysaccharide assembly protein LptE/RlpB
MMPRVTARTASFSRVLISLAFLLYLTACGYRLAGTVELPPQLATINLITNDFREIQRKALVRTLQTAGASLVEQSNADAIRLTVTLDSPPDRQLATSASSGTIVVRIVRNLTFALHSADGKVVSPAQTVSQQADISLNDDSLLASNQERDNAIVNLEQALYQRLVLQLTRI